MVNNPRLFNWPEDSLFRDQTNQAMMIFIVLTNARTRGWQFADVKSYLLLVTAAHTHTPTNTATIWQGHGRISFTTNTLSAK